MAESGQWHEELTQSLDRRTWCTLSPLSDEALILSVAEMSAVSASDSAEIPLIPVAVAV